MKSDNKIPSSAGAGNNKKRKYHASGRDSKPSSRSSGPMVLQNPKRGAPGFLMTCEQGKEQKCQREGLEMIQYYYSSRIDPESTSTNEQLQEDPDNQDNGKPTPLSLEEELKQLQENKGDGSPSNFGIFQTGCRGTVFVLCTVPGSEMIPSLKEQKKHLATAATDEDDTTDHAQEDGSTPSKKLRTDIGSSEIGNPEEATDNAARDKEATSQVVSNLESQAATPSSSTAAATTEPTNATWDPVPIVRQMFQDIATDSAKDAPSSRFVTRMIPIQVTCYTSEEEIALASRLLMQHYLPKSTQTFGIALKRRLCHEQLTKEKIITIVAKEVVQIVPTCKVQLDNPEITIVVEICKTLCGISIVPHCEESFGNFNLAVAREKVHPEDSDE